MFFFLFKMDSVSLMSLQTMTKNSNESKIGYNIHEQFDISHTSNICQIHVVMVLI